MVISAVVIVAMALYHTLSGNEVAGTIKEKVRAAIQGESTGIHRTFAIESEPKKEKSAPKEEKEDSTAVSSNTFENKKPLVNRDIPYYTFVL